MKLRNSVWISALVVFALVTPIACFNMANKIVPDWVKGMATIGLKSIIVPMVLLLALANRKMLRDIRVEKNDPLKSWMLTGTCLLIVNFTLVWPIVFAIKAFWMK